MKNQETRKKRKWPIVVAILVLLLLAAILSLFILGRKATTAIQNSVTTEAVFTGSISVTTEGSGSVEAASTKALALEYDGKLETIYVEKGDQVQPGDVLAIYDTDALDSVIEAKEAELEQLNSTIVATDDSGSTSITAPVTGRVKRIYASTDDVVSNVVDANGGLAEISADGKLKVEFPLPETTLYEGDSVTVDFDSKSADGTVEKIEDGIVRVTIKDDTEYMVDTTAVVRGKSGVKLGEGILLSNHPYLVTASYGIIDSVEVTKTSFVNAGDVLFTRRDAAYNQTYLDLLTDREELIEELQELKEYQKNPVVTADCEGYIVSLDVLEGMPYEKDQQFCTIADAQTLNLKVEIDELDIDGVEVGQHASVVFDAFEDETYDGTVEKISGVGTNSGGVTTYTVTIALEGDTHLKNAMSATAAITLASKDNVLLIPVDAIETIEGQKYVQVMDGDLITQTPVTLGLVNTEYAEVTEGLTSGQQVVVNTRTSTDILSAMMAQRDSMMGGSRN
ncbi:MAG: HlyD family efflux transporter periplasmic adaptor subunit [Eubacteriales bacterium]|nr:HlyD family efflux transporter periplasmic adaptor subunit [Eubacteriales bacterium]